MSNHAAALVVFLAWYVAAVATTLFVTDMANELLGLLGFTLLWVIGFMSVVFALSRVLKRTDVVDMAWGPAGVVAAIASFSLNPYGVSVGLNVQTLVTVLVTIWAGRLAFIIFQRIRSKPEDPRYVQLRNGWKGNEFLNTYLRIFLTQALLATIIALAVINANLSLPAQLNNFAYAGLIIWLIGFLFETVGDLQLKRFLSDPKNKGKLMTRGLWKYTRHPNYFGEATMWWGIFVIALATPYGWFGVVSPVIITYLLLYVSGVPMTEKAFESKPGWNAYRSSTSKFFPLPPNETRADEK